MLFTLANKLIKIREIGKEIEIKCQNVLILKFELKKNSFKSILLS